jgi:hypothetical protein
MQRPAGGPVEYTQHDVWRLKNPNTLEMSINQHFKDRDTVRNEQRIYRKAK